ncbi:MAG: NAD(P)H-hydrate dehydratase [Clostridia bacterium]|nr:NAD(P)H-hydrate dehydratase [Clostridia bacterium]
MKVYTADEIRFVEERENETGIQFIRLMENAGAACAKRIEKHVKKGCTVCVVCGKGKNGGDGFVIARKLVEEGIRVQIVLAQGAPLATDAIDMYHKVDSMIIDIIRYDWDPELAASAIASADIIVDCIFGIGFHGEPDDACSEVFQMINRSTGYVYAVDVPSGVNTDTGEACEYAVNADETLAITVLKPAHVLFPSRELCGKVSVLDIGIGEEALNSVSPRLEALDSFEVSRLLPERLPQAHKNDFGHVLLICGSMNMPGAACLSSGAACVAGAGLTTVAFPQSAYPAISTHMREVMLLPLPDIDGKFAATFECISQLSEFMQKADAIVIGPGLGQSDDVTEFVTTILRSAKCPVVIDADALNALAHDLSVLSEVSVPVVMTPHPGEMARLTGLSAEEIEQSREGIAEEFAKRHNVTLLLKGAATVVASPGTSAVFVNTTGNAALAKGGSGDVLAGIIGSLLAQGLGAYDAACCGAFIHGRAADLMAGETGKASMLASDLFAGIRRAYVEMGK